MCPGSQFAWSSMSSICLGNNEPIFREYVSFIMINEVHNELPTGAFRDCGVDLGVDFAREGRWLLRWLAPVKSPGFEDEVRPVQCLHPAPSGPCLVVDRPARVDLLVSAGWNQAPARPAHEWSMQAVIGRSCASQPPAWTRWLVHNGRGQPEDLG